MAVIQSIKKLCEGQDYKDWLDERPQLIKNMITNYPPYILYLYKPTNHRCHIVGYYEDGTVRVAITGEYNRIAFGRTVFGIKLTDLEECEFPGPTDPVGDISQEIGLTQDEIVTYARGAVASMKQEKKKDST